MASRYFVGGGTGNWNSTTNWSATDGGASGASFPTSADDVFLTASSGTNTLTVNVSSACLTINCTGFTGTLTMSALLTTYGSVTLASGMTISGSSTLAVAGSVTATFTSNGKTWPTPLTFGVTNTITLVGDWVNTGLVTANASTTINKTTAETFTCAGGYTFGTSSTSNTGTAEIILTGGTYTPSTSTGVLQNNCTFAGNVTISNGTTFRYSTGILKYTSGSVTTTNTTLACNASTTLNTNGITWDKVSLTGAVATFTLTSSLICTGLLTFATGSNIITINRTTAETITTSGGLTQGGATSTIAGTAEIIVTGGTITGPSSTGYLANNLTLSGSCTFAAGAFTYRTGTLKYTAGTITVAGSTLACAASTIFDCAGVTWDNVTLTGASTFTLIGNVNVSGTLTIGSGNNSVVFAGTAQLIPTGAVSVANGSGTVTVSSSASLKLTQTQTFTKTSTGLWSVNIIVDAAGKTVTFAGDCAIYLGHMNCIAGTIITDLATWTVFGGGSGGGLILPRPMNGGYSG